MTPLSQLTEDIQTAALQIEAFRKYAALGQAIDLSGMETRIEHLCAAATSLAPDDRAMVKNALLGLMDEMNSLVETLEAAKQEVAGQIGGLTARQKAMSAYGTGASSTKPNTEK